MAWDDSGDDRRELLRHVDYDSRRAHYKAVSRATLYFLIVVIICMMAALFGYWYIALRLSAFI